MSPCKYSVSIALFVATSVALLLLNTKKKPISKRRHSKSLNLADDNCQSLFYDENISEDGKGFPTIKSISNETIKQLKQIQPEYKKLPFQLYKQTVENLIVVCVDIICQRKSDSKLLLFYRRDSPASKIWWWPGGRMYRGETFYDTAIRKIREETGKMQAKIEAKAVIHVWNTFFPDSNWDSERKPGYEGTQTVNIVVLCEFDDTLNDTENMKIIESEINASEVWAIDAHRWISVVEAATIGNYDKYVQLNVELALNKHLLTL